MRVVVLRCSSQSCCRRLTIEIEDDVPNTPSEIMSAVFAESGWRMITSDGTARPLCVRCQQ